MTPGCRAAAGSTVRWPSEVYRCSTAAQRSLERSVTTTPSWISRFQASTQVTSPPEASATPSAVSTARVLASLPSTATRMRRGGTTTVSEGTTATGQWAWATTGRATDPSRIRSSRPRAGAPTTSRAASSDSRTRAAAGGPQGTAVAMSRTSSRRRGPDRRPGRGCGARPPRGARPGSAPRRPGLVGRELDLRVDDRHQAQWCPEPRGLVGCPVDDRLIGRRTVDGDDHGSVDADELGAGPA